jgi:hypothetical protein
VHVIPVPHGVPFGLTGFVQAPVFGLQIPAE